jgi:CRISPR-associated protein Csm1
VQRLALRLSQDFRAYTTQNRDIHFSAGIATQKPGAPIGAMADLAEDALAAAKRRQGKSALTCFGETVAWADWPKLEEAIKRLNELRETEKLSAAYVYGLLQFVELRQSEQQGGKPEAAIWRSRFAYQTQRYIVDKRRDLNDDERQALYQRLVRAFGSAIESMGPSYRVALFNHLYQFRSR